MGAQCHLRTTVHTSRNSHGEVETLSFEDPNVSSKITIQNQRKILLWNRTGLTRNALIIVNICGKNDLAGRHVNGNTGALDATDINAKGAVYIS